MGEKLNRRKEDSTGPGVPEVQRGQGPEGRILLTEAPTTAEEQEGQPTFVPVRTPVVKASPYGRPPTPTRIQQGVQSYLNFVYKKFAEQIASVGQSLLNRARTTVSYFLAAFSKKNPPAVPVGA